MSITTGTIQKLSLAITLTKKNIEEEALVVVGLEEQIESSSINNDTHVFDDNLCAEDTLEALMSLDDNDVVEELNIGNSNNNYEDEKDTHHNLINLLDENNNIKDANSDDFCVFVGEQQQETVNANNTNNALFERHTNATNKMLLEDNNINTLKHYYR